jgi:ABC transporter substrate binding protein (PQQ-dependent alcohol dehydrogenase system)
LYLSQQVERPALLSKLVVRPTDEGDPGARLGVADNNTTGKFLKIYFKLQEIIAKPSENLVELAKDAINDGSRLVIVNAPAETLNAIADMPGANDDLIFNAGSARTSLRSEECRKNILHTLPSRTMLSDALMQFFSKRRWKSLFLIEGLRPKDTAFANALRESAKKFRLKIAEDKKWLADADIRRTASTEIPAFTQASAYDVVVVADEDRDFSPFILYNTWLPRPVGGNAGVRPLAWSHVIEQWGAVQLQNRFKKISERQMTSRDYAAWAAVRSIGEAVLRTNVADPDSLRSYMLSEKFALAGFKGTKLTFRPWNGQLRQAIPLVHANGVVASAPLEGFLHKRTELDTLGLDKPISKCSKF